MAADANMSTSAPAGLERIRSWLRSDLRVLRWVFAGLYCLLIIAPLALLGPSGGATLPLLIMMAVMIAAQAVFIFGAGTIQLCRPIRRRRLLLPVVTAALMFTILLVGLFLALIELLDGEDVVNEDVMVVVFWGLIIVSWVTWGALLFAYAKNWPRIRVLSRLSAALFAGSLLELLATVPSHVIVIRRPGCLVGIGTMMGIVAGLNVMFFSFGPMIAVLFLRPRYRRELAMGDQFCHVCGYDLRASPQRCPECGTLRKPLPAAHDLPAPSP